MKFADKKKAYQQMQDPAHLKCDRDLLARKAPKSVALTTGLVNKEKAQRDILWALLDVAEVDEILKNRIPVGDKKPPLSDDELKDIEKKTKHAEAIQKLLSLDLEKASQPVMANLVRVLGIVPIDFKAATIRPILIDFISNIEKADEHQEETIPVEVHLEAVNELTDENEQLKGELEEKELENEDLQEQLEEKEAELEDTAAELAEAKKKAESDPE